MGSVSAGIRSVAAGTTLIALLGIMGCDWADTSKAVANTNGVAATQRTNFSANLCGEGEKVFFSCQIGAKRVAVCGTGGGAVYRYGTPGKVELTSRSLHYATQGYSGGGETQVTATNGPYSYTVFDRTVRTGFGAAGQNDPASTSGLLVRKGGKVVSSRACTEETPVATAIRQTVPAGAFVRH